MTLEPITEDDAEELFPGEGSLAIENLRALLDDIEKDSVLDSDVLDALERARSALGGDGAFNVAEVQDGGVCRRITIDADRMSLLRERATRREPNLVRISGRLHMIDLEPPLKVGIRSTDGIDWICRYEAEFEPKVKALLDSNVWVSGTGTLTGAQRGTLEIEDIRPVSEFEQSPLFTPERVSVEDLLAQQGIRGPQGEEALGLPTEVTDEELEDYLNALLDD